MEVQKTKYNAFISYRHAELDKFVAENLHRLLETYKMPKQVVEKYNITDNNMRRIFRDQEELPLSSNLQDPIYEALSQSKFLIVICSPRLKESKWCKKEIQTFIKMHGRKNILCVLIEGEPQASFPEELLYYKEKTKTKTGKERIKKIPCEPLAMDVRGNNKKEVYQKLKTELIRIIAPMYHLDYDDIKRRHEERKLKQKVKIFRIITMISIVFTLYSAILFFKIYISSQQLKYDQAINLAMLSSERLSKDDRKGAIEKAYQSVTKYDNITSKGIYQLTESLGIYYTPENYYPISQLNTEGIVESIKIDTNQKYLLSYDNSGELVLWNLETENKIKTITNIDPTTNENKYTFINNAYAYLNNNKEIIIENFEGEKIKVINLNQRINNLTASKKYLEINTENKIYIYETDTYQQIATYETSNNIKKIYFDEKEENIIIYTNPNNEIITYNIEKKSPIVKTNTNDVIKILFKDDYAIILSTEKIKLNTNMIITNYNYKTGKKYYQRKYEKEYPSDISLKYTEENQTILVSAYDTTYLLDFNTGEEKTRFSIGNKVINSYSINNSNTYILFTRNGETHNIDATLDASFNEDNDIIITGLFNFNLPNYEKYLYTNKGILAYVNNDNRIIIYGHLKNDDMKEIEYEEKNQKNPIDKKAIIAEYNFKKKDFIYQLTYSADKKLLFVSYKNNTLEIYDNNTKKLINTIEGIKYIDEYLGKYNNKHIIKGNGKGYILDKNFELIAYVPNLYDYNNHKLIIKTNQKYYEIKLYNEKELIEKAKQIEVE